MLVIIYEKQSTQAIVHNEPSDWKGYFKICVKQRGGYFITCEATGWIPNYRDIGGTLFGRITESSIFREWFTFYETPNFNLLTICFGILLVYGIIGAIKNVFSSSST